MAKDKTHVTKQNEITVLKVDEQKGIIGAIVNVYGIVDLGNDRTNLGMFKKSIQEAFPAGKIKVLDNHNTNSITDILGKPIAMREVSKQELPESVLKKYPEATGGLYTETQYNLNTQKGRDAFHLIKDGMITEYSIGFYLYDYDLTQESGKSIRDIKTGHLLEYSPVLWGMNQATLTTSVKRDETSDNSDIEQDQEQAVESDEQDAKNEHNTRVFAHLTRDELFPFKNANNADEIIEAIADLLADGDESYQRKRATIKLEKRLSTVFTDAQLKSVALRHIDRAVSMQFYRTFDSQDAYYWVYAVYDGYLVVENEQDNIEGRFYRINYSINLDTMQVTFDESSNWTQGRLGFIEHNFDESIITSPQDETSEAGQLTAQSDEPAPTSMSQQDDKHQLEQRRLVALERAQSLTFN